MSGKEMDSEKYDLPFTRGQRKHLKYLRYFSNIYINGRHSTSLFEALDCLRKEEQSCDIKLETDDGVIVCAHKVVLIAASPYFREMFSKFTESVQVRVNIREFDSNILQLLVDYIYTGRIMVKKENVMGLLPAANLLQLDCVKLACAECLREELNHFNCLSFKKFADTYDCMELYSSSEEYIKTHFPKVVEADEFLSLSLEEVINLISRDDINVPFEETIFECVIKWVKYELNSRCFSFPKLMKHVRLSLTPIEFIQLKVGNEPLIKNNPECKDFIIEAINFHTMLEKGHRINIPKTIRNSSRQHGLKFLLASCDSSTGKCFTRWYDSTTKIMYKRIEMSLRNGCALALINEHLVIALGNHLFNPRTISMLDLSLKSLQWNLKGFMKADRSFFGVGVLNHRLYAVGGTDGDSLLNSAEVLDLSIEEWRFIKPMSIERTDLSVGVLNNLIYAVGGYNYSYSLKSVECYDPSLDTWTPVAPMSTGRRGLGIGVLDGIMYAIGGNFKTNIRTVTLKTVETYSPIAKVWSPIASMHYRRYKPSVVIHNGLLYVFGGFVRSTPIHTAEQYDPTTNTWTIVNSLSGIEGICSGVVVEVPLHCRTN